MVFCFVFWYIDSAMKNMNKEQKVGIIIIIIIVLGLVYFNVSKKEEVVENTDQKIEENTQELLKEETKIPVQNTVKTPSAKDSFNIAMTKGNTSFSAKRYEEAAVFFKEALNYKDSDTVYIRLFDVYNAQNNIDEARVYLEKAIQKNPAYTEYRTTKLVFLDEKTNISYLDLKKIYEDALPKVDTRTKVNLVTTFARVAEANKQYGEAAFYFGYAKEIYPANAAIFQAEIDRLHTLK